MFKVSLLHVFIRQPAMVPMYLISERKPSERPKRQYKHSEHLNIVIYALLKMDVNTDTFSNFALSPNVYLKDDVCIFMISFA